MYQRELSLDLDEGKTLNLMRSFTFLSFLLFSISGIAQFSEEKILIACEICESRVVFSTDLDGDGDNRRAKNRYGHQTEASEDAQAQ